MSPTPRRLLGIDVGGTKILGVLVDEDLNVLAEHTVPSRREEGPEAVLARCIELVHELGGATPAQELAGIGVGFAGLVDDRRGIVRSSIMLPGWDGFPLVRRLEAELGIPGVIENDATAAGFGEFQALGAPEDLTLVLLTIGTGIGGAIFLGGRNVRGRSGLAGEFGNMSIDWRGDPCWCGSKGCLNMLASGSAIVRRAGLLAPPDVDVDNLQEVVRERAGGAGWAARAIEEGARALGAGIANIVNAFNPDRVSLCGGVLSLGEDYLACVRDEAGKRAFAESLADVTIDGAKLGNRSGAVGAAYLARERASTAPTNR